MAATKQTTLKFTKQKADMKPLCRYGEKCYQKNPNHLQKYHHPEKSFQSEKDVRKRNACEAFSADEDSLPSVDAHASSSLPADTSSPPRKQAKLEETSSLTADSSIAAENCTFTDEDEQELPSSPADLQENIKQKFLVEMPEDFYKFWDFCEELNKENPSDALLSCGIRLVGAYDVVAGKDLKPRCLSRYLCHWRFYHDPPEMQTILTCGNDGYHIGYFRDCPSEAPVFVASMSDVKPGLVSPLGDNIFDALRVYCKEAEKKADTFKKPAFSKLISQLEDAAKTHGFKLDSKTDAVRQRKKKVVCRSFHGAGIVVPYDKETDVGYREIPETDANLRKMLQRVSDAKNPAARSAAFATVQEVITNSQWATDEGDFGMGLELGMDLFLFGCPHLHSSAKHLMTVAYDLLGRQEFSTILKAHLKNRRKGHNLSAFN